MNYQNEKQKMNYQYERRFVVEVLNKNFDRNGSVMKKIRSTFLLLALLIALPQSAGAEGDATPAPPVDGETLELLKNYFNEVQFCALQGSDPAKTRAISVWCAAAHVKEGAFKPPSETKIYVGIASRFFIENMKSDLAKGREYNRKFSEAKTESEQKMLIGDYAISSLSFETPELAILLVGPQRLQVTALTPSDSNEKQTLNCVEKSLVKSLLGKNNANSIAVNKALEDYLQQMLRTSSQYEFKASSGGVVTVQKRLSVWLTQVHDPVAGDVYISAENDRTPGKKNVYLSLFPIKSTQIEPSFESSCK